MVIMIGIVTDAFDVTADTYPGNTADSYGFYVHNGYKYGSGNGVVFVNDTPQNGDVIGVLLDLETRTLTYFKNGKILGTAFGLLPADGHTIKYYPAVGCHQLGQWTSFVKTLKD